MSEEFIPVCSYWECAVCKDPVKMMIYVKRLSTSLPYCKRHGRMVLEKDGYELRVEIDP